MTLILASTSRYRRELLGRLRLPFQVARPEVDETPGVGESPPALARRLARAKAEAIAAQFPDVWVIGSDQVAALGSQPLGKPGTRDRAIAQLGAMSGREIHFHTAIALVRGDVVLQAMDTTRAVSYTHLDVYKRQPTLGSSALKPTDTPTGLYNRSRLAPSACRWVLRIPVSLSALSTTAPAPVSYTHLDVYKRQLPSLNHPSPSATQRCRNGCLLYTSRCV